MIFRNIVDGVEPPSKINLWLEGLRLKRPSLDGWVSLTGMILETPEKGVVLNPDFSNEAKGEGSLASGNHTLATNPAESAFGKHNFSHTSDDPASSTLWSVGTGNALLRRNGIEVMGNGDLYLTGVGNYNGRNAGGVDVLSIQEVLNAAVPSPAPKPLDTFDATPLLKAYQTPGDHKVTAEFQQQLVDAVKRNAFITITGDDGKGFSYKVVVIFAGKDDKHMSFTASDHVAHYEISLDLGTNIVSMDTVGILKKYRFSLDTTPEAKAENLRIANEILFDKVENVCVKGTIDGVTYDTIGVYSNGTIAALQGDYHLVFDVNFDTGEITIISKSKVSSLLTCTELQVGNDESVMQFNRENLTAGVFFLKLDYGYGVGTFQPEQGGFAHITSAKGDEVFYNITPTGAVIRDDDYVKPLHKATPKEVGGITQGAAISNAGYGDAINKFNQLLEELRKSGVLAR